MNITLLNDKYDPETTAMLQAFYSRNHKPIKVRLSELGDDTQKVKKGLEKWYVGYGHDSIGQCGSFTIFIENVSFLAAKAIQDSPLYNGQESSSRYIDFSNQPMFEPFETDIQKAWLDFYTNNQQEVINHVAETYNLDLTDTIQYKTAKARAFDILRGFLPAGCTTQLSWHTTFTHANDRLVQLLFHPLEEVQHIAQTIIEQCVEVYPYAFAGIDKKINRYRDYYQKFAKELNYLSEDFQYEIIVENDVYLMNYEQFANQGVSQLDFDIVNERPKGLMLSKLFSFRNRFELAYLLDFGSFRDIQRHRNCVQPMPLLTTKYGFHTWYIESLPETLQETAIDLIDKQESLLSKIDDEITKQYLIPLGYKVTCALLCDLPQLVYLAELRTSKTVHPTLRNIAKQFAKLASHFVSPVYSDMSEDEIDIKRGTQDIVEK